MSKIVLYETDAVIAGEAGVHKLVARAAGLHEIRSDGTEHAIGDVAVDAHVAAADPHDQYALALEVGIELAAKVDKVTGKGLSTNDYTSAEKTKLSGVAAGATANATDATLRDRATHTGTQAISTVTGLGAALAAKIESSEKGAANGLAPLGADSKIAAAYLPSYVDDVLEYTNFAAFPGMGETGKIYVDLVTGKTWRWGGSAYSEISASPGSTDAVPEGVTNQYFTLARVRDTLLAGLSLASSAVVAASDSVLGAIGKLQAQLALKASLSGADFTGGVTVGGGTGVKSLGVLSGGGADIYVGQSGGTTLFGIANTAVVGVFNASAVPIGIGSTANQPLIFGTGNAERARITGSGNILIGSSTDNGIAKLQVSDRVSVTSATQNGISIFGGFPGGGIQYANLLVGAAADTYMSCQVGYAYDSATPTASFFHLTPYGLTEGITFKLTASGRLVLGTTADNGVDKLQVAGSAYVNGLLSIAGDYTAMLHEGSPIGYVGKGSSLAFGGGATEFTVRANSNMLFVAGGGDERMRLTSGGNLLIGTTADGGQKLQVAGTSRFASTVIVDTSAAALRTTSVLNFRMPRNSVSNAQGLAFSGGNAFDFLIGRHPNSDDLVFGVDNGDTFFESMQIRQNGHVLIGKTTDDGNNKLQVAGGVVVSAGTTGSASHMALTWDSSGGNIQSYLNKPLCMNPLGNRVLIGRPFDRGSDALQVNGSIELIGQINSYSGADLEIVQRTGGNIVLYTGAVVPTATFSPTGLSLPNGFGCNGAAPQTAVAVNGPATDEASAIALINQLRAALVANGIAI